jgi:CheY-like chemotaxis protein
VSQIDENQHDFDGLDADERDICVYLASCGGQFASKTEIARRAGGKRRFQDDPKWVVHALARLTENGTIESNSNGHYCLRSVRQIEAAQEQSDPPAWNCKGRKILIVDFDADWRNVVSAFLQEAGGEILAATDAIDGMVQTAGTSLDLVILDLNLDVDSGLELLKLLNLYQPDARVILCTRQGQDQEAVQAMLQQGTVEYVHKGHLDELRRAVQMALIA